MKKQNNKNSLNIKTKISFALSIVLIILEIINIFVLKDETLAIMRPLLIISFIGAITFGILSLIEVKKKSLDNKKYAVFSIVLPFILLIIFGIIIIIYEKDEFVQIFKCPDVTDCVDNGDDTSTCQFEGENFVCANELLEPEQYK